MKRLNVLILMLLLGICAIAQTKDEAVTNLRHQILDYPQEKLYLQMDRPQYDAGDTIWFRAHTVSEAFHLPSAMSRGIFVNLYGPDNKLVERFPRLWFFQKKCRKGPTASQPIPNKCKANEAIPTLPKPFQ
jgi:hypothetical protein